MEEERKQQIYERLLATSITMEARDLPDPRYINECLSLCHQYVGEVEKYYIEVSQETSTLRKALNNAISEYEHKRDNLMSHPDIQDLPSIKDREAKANHMLKDHLEEIKTLRNDINDLDGLFKAINLKNRNLNRINMDIKVQMRLMESQIKLGVLPGNDKVAHDLLKSMKDSAIGQDVFDKIETKAEHEKVVDPTDPVNIDNLLKDSTDEVNVQQLLSGIGEEEEKQVPEETSVEEKKKLTPEEESDRDYKSIENLINPDSVVTSDYDPDEDILGEPSEIDEDNETVGIDLDKAIDIDANDMPELEPAADSEKPQTSSEGGSEEVTESKVESKTQSEPQAGPENQKADKDDINIDALLSQFT